MRQLSKDNTEESSLAGAVDTYDGGFVMLFYIKVYILKNRSISEAFLDILTWLSAFQGYLE